MSSSLTSTIPPSWQHAWEAAQPRLVQIKDSLVSSTSPAPRITRVGQLDAELLDQELVQLLTEPLVKALSLVNSAWKARFEPEVALFIQLTLYKLSVWNTGASYGAGLQGLRYATQGGSGRNETGAGLSYHTLILHGALTTLVPYCHTRLRNHALSQAWPDAPSSDRRRKAWELLTRVESTHGLFGLLNFIAFLWNGRFRTLADRLFGLRLVPTQRLTRRDVSYEYMNRQMVWHAFTEFLLFLLPLINTRALRRWISISMSRLTPSSLLPGPVRSFVGLKAQDDAQTVQHTRRGPYWSLPEDQCAICVENASTNFNLNDPANAFSSVDSLSPYSNANTPQPGTDATGHSDEPPAYPIHNSYITSCEHVYCYYCISERMVRTAEDRSGSGPGGTRWECLRCTEGVIGADRLEAEAEGSEYESGEEDDEDDLDFDYGSEDMEFTDMSGSMGSYSESGMSE
ncbi:peroxisomal biogenesis factor 2 [Laetiporus sulphureus 93-53]|uniref:RING-type E3 ubiquitin transferase (cysteine targeting) n=1 Tax=Laetiporus sulphureus 93-53 TaxID=1314785 RepID=A0A165I9H9_9APHY|nr:peroxisomal biogenesis factor 2 [Laetiporus sulphureus 93-53]KZT12767.1 peroxisomal biogenesis factor 2 [Laetiporus sulphureus 93-53]